MAITTKVRVQRARQRPGLRKSTSHHNTKWDIGPELRRVSVMKYWLVGERSILHGLLLLLNGCEQPEVHLTGAVRSRGIKWLQRHRSRLLEHPSATAAQGAFSVPRDSIVNSNADKIRTSPQAARSNDSLQPPKKPPLFPHLTLSCKAELSSTPEGTVSWLERRRWETGNDLTPGNIPKQVPWKSKDQLPDWKKNQLELEFAKMVTTKLREGMYHPIGYPFYGPVDPVKNPPLPHTVIQKPMDLRIIHLKLRAGQYANVREFENDIRLMFQNCYASYHPDSTLYGLGKQFKLVFEIQWARKDQWLLRVGRGARSAMAGGDEEVNGA